MSVVTTLFVVNSRYRGTISVTGLYLPCKLFALTIVYKGLQTLTMLQTRVTTLLVPCELTLCKLL